MAESQWVQQGTGSGCIAAHLDLDELAGDLVAFRHGTEIDDQRLQLHCA